MSAAAMKQRKRIQLKTSTRNNLVGWGFAMPALVGFALLNIMPMVLSLYYSFCEYSTLSTGKPLFIGLQNYITLLGGSDPHFFPAVRATAIYALMAVPANLLFSFAIAMMLNRPMVGRTLFRAVFYMPCIVPAVASSFVWLLMLNPEFGLFNHILKILGLPQSKFLWSTKSVLPTIAFMGIWTTGGAQVILLAGLQGIPRVYYEALTIDGGNSFHKLIYITLPMLSSTIFFNLVNGIIGALQVFSAAYIMTDGGPNNSSLFYMFALWRKAFTYSDTGLASAMAWLLFLTILLLTALVFSTSKKWVYYEGGE